MSLLEISYKKHDQISLEKLAAFITACRLRKPRTPITNKFNTSDIKRILVIISESSLSYAGKNKRKGNYQVALKEYPLPEDIPIYLHSIREKTPKQHKIDQIAGEMMEEEDISMFLTEDLNSIYTEGLDHRLYTIPMIEKSAFYLRYGTPSILSQIATLKPLKVEKVENTSTNKEKPYCDVVMVNGKKMFMFKKRTKNCILAIDCEMVITDLGCELARISIVNKYKKAVYDQIIIPEGKVTDYISDITGISESTYDKKCTCTTCEDIAAKRLNIEDNEEGPAHSGCITYDAMLYDLSKIIGKNTILIGHSISHDLLAMNVFHKNIIDTSLLFNSKTHHRYKLKSLCSTYLNKEIQETEHSSIIDAEACIDLVSYLVRRRIPSLHYQKMKNLTVSTDYNSATSQKITHKGTPPIDYVYTNCLPEDIDANTVIICLERTKEEWTVRVSNT
ncbi:RNA exonuclease [Nematocida sp. AWRm78]|nr:RNA exonuclease [Nematocida sp. AWRm79]KAI5185014.1 RNA exonuclease [Nematocida sp. AWRm78]